jgi:hypothetical protein
VDLVQKTGQLTPVDRSIDAQHPTLFLSRNVDFPPELPAPQVRRIALRHQVCRYPKRFPPDFFFELTGG